LKLGKASAGLGQNKEVGSNLSIRRCLSPPPLLIYPYMDISQVPLSPPWRRGEDCSLGWGLGRWKEIVKVWDPAAKRTLFGYTGRALEKAPSPSLARHPPCGTPAVIIRA
jgi:hypothetical protein